MADPISVVGTAVGIVSASIQICKGTIWYIDTVKDAKEKAQHIRNEVDQLAKILESLETTVTRAGLSSTSTLTVTYSLFSACASDI
jgi:RAB protein geranylgeranyltransferase component A